MGSPTDDAQYVTDNTRTTGKISVETHSDSHTQAVRDMVRRP